VVSEGERKAVIAPVATTYRGVKYRSRLEARWSILFSKLGVVHEYEKSTFLLDKLGLYTPDLWLPKQRCWVEIKPPFDVVPQAELAKPASLHKRTGATVLVLVGNVYPSAHTVLVFSAMTMVDTRGFADHRSVFAYCDACGGLSVVVIAPGCVQWLTKVELQPVACTNHTPRVATEGNVSRLEQAYTAARLTRFD
jgi:hypothetical protein